jgi:hypothetical protein
MYYHFSSSLLLVSSGRGHVLSRGVSETSRDRFRSGRPDRRRRDLDKSLAYVDDDGATNYSVERQIAMEGEFFQALARRGGATRFFTKLAVFAMLTSPFWIILWIIVTGQ